MWYKISWKPTYQHTGFYGLSKTSRFQNAHHFLPQHGPLVRFQADQHDADAHKVEGIIWIWQAVKNICNLETHVWWSNLLWKDVAHVDANAIDFGILGSDIETPSTVATSDVEHFSTIFERSWQKRKCLIDNVAVVWCRFTSFSSLHYPEILVPPRTITYPLNKDLMAKCCYVRENNRM